MYAVYMWGSADCSSVLRVESTLSDVALVLRADAVVSGGAKVVQNRQF